MGVALDQLAFKLFGHRLGSWFWIANSLSVHPRLQHRWDLKPGDHPFILMADVDGGLAVPVRARSLSNRTGLAHAAHPNRHSPSCRIRRDGWIVRKAWSLRTEVLKEEYFSCVEPDEAVLTQLREMAGTNE